MYPTLGDMVASLERGGELTRIGEPVSPVLTIAAMADAESKRPAPHPGSQSSRSNDPEFCSLGGQALLFEQVKGSDFPVLINAFGSYRRMEMALGVGDGQSEVPGEPGRPSPGFLVGQASRLSFAQSRAHARGSERRRGEDAPAHSGLEDTACKAVPPHDGFEAIAAQIASLTKPELPRSIGEAFAKVRQLLPLIKIAPKRLRGPGVCQEVVRTNSDIDLTRLPMLRCWPDDGDFAAMGYPAGINDGIEGLGHPNIDAARWEREFRGRYITFAGVHTIHADDRHAKRPRSHNIGMYRVQLMGKDRLAMHWHMHHDGAAHWRSWKELGQPMPVAIALGGPSVLPYAATCPLPPGVSELLMAGFLQGRGVRMCKAKTVPLWVPADAEIVIEGFVRTDAGMPGWEPNESKTPRMSAANPADHPEPSAEPLGPGAVFEGPFGDHTGFYSLPDRYPLTEVSAITHRKNAVFPATVVGMPVQEDYFLGKATERIMRPLLQTLIPEIVDYDLPRFGAFHNCAFIQIDASYPLHAHKVMHAIWGAGQMAWTKTIFVVDKDVDVHDASAVLAACERHCDPRTDIAQVRGPLDILDHAAPQLGAGTKLGFDCTRKADTTNKHRLTGDAIARDLERMHSLDGVLGAEVTDRAPGWLFVRTDRGHDEPEHEKLGRKVLKRFFKMGAGGCRFVVTLGRDVDIADHHVAIFHWLANCDAGRDALRDDRHGRIGFDATPKTAGDRRNGLPVRRWAPVLGDPSEPRP